MNVFFALSRVRIYAKLSILLLKQVYVVIKGVHSCAPVNKKNRYIISVTEYESTNTTSVVIRRRITAIVPFKSPGLKIHDMGIPETKRFIAKGFELGATSSTPKGSIRTRITPIILKL